MKTTQSVTWTHPFLSDVLRLIPEDAKTLLDVGSGFGVMGAIFNLYRTRTFSSAIDAWEPYLIRASKHYDETILWDVSLGWPKLARRHYDVATVIEVVEHLPKNAGAAVLDRAEELADTVIVTTPRKFFTQDHYDENPFQAHISAWRKSDFKRRGYSVLPDPPIRIAGRLIPSVSWRLNRLFRPLESETIIASRSSR